MIQNDFVFDNAGNTGWKYQIADIFYPLKADLGWTSLKSLTDERQLW